ncbi:hypothetical protein NVP1278O_18 [Vibrio phage 1.278.O._10N.286.54.E8]|nr:hypothetical protein NVP1278O_18 [Vibrio phage 1.278.O._10N.286.54.E8]
MITCKEDLIGTEFKVTCKEEASLLKEKCKSLGIEHATWRSCSYTGGVMRGVVAKDLGTYHSCKLLFTDKPEDSDSMDEFKSLRFVDIKELKPKPTPTKFVKVEESIFDLKGEFERGELYSSDCEGHYTQLKCEKKLYLAAHQYSVYRQVEIDWSDELDSYLDSISSLDSNFDEKVTLDFSKSKFAYSLSDDEFVAACHLVASLTEKPEGV